ncbi:hypothetical protein [Azonexus sp. R2A61]|uniref:hypothetical protein n=1 Tax=Azonexus sp. R2A61 TaxID=2744443 RepID=UPI001F466E4A|nr:hypothetical protein [Azonexus sp. R2A61]
MWPFKKKQTTQPEALPPASISYSQVDTTERFGDNLGLAQDEWIATIPLNEMTQDPESMGLPSVGASADEVFRVASRLSQLRESIPIPTDGVYCAVCHIANIDIGKLRSPCPQCGRELLKFGWD